MFPPQGYFCDGSSESKWEYRRAVDERHHARTSFGDFDRASSTWSAVKSSIDVGCCGMARFGFAVCVTDSYMKSSVDAR